MKIINLLEGSERLFHSVVMQAVESILDSGKFVFSQLISNELEVRAMKYAYNSTDKLYYFSFARSIKSAYIGESTRRNQCLFEFSGRKVSRYGKIVPLNFFNGPNDEIFDEMEDRLVTNKSSMPVTVCECMHVMCEDRYVERFIEFNKRYGIEIKFYRRISDFQMLRRSMTIEERVSYMDKSVDHQRLSSVADAYGRASDYFNAMRGIESFLGDKKIDFDVESAKRGMASLHMNKLLWVIRIQFHDEGHELVAKIKKSGYNTPIKIINLQSSVREWLNGLGVKNEDN